MARQIGRLSALSVTRAKTSGMYPDGGGLYLRIAEDGGRGWFFRYVLKGRQRYMGLGSASAISLATARLLAQDARALKARGIDPIDARAAWDAAQRAELAKVLTFKQATEAYLRSHKAGWRNSKHGDQWENTLSAYAYPVFGDLPVQAVDASLVLKVLEPIWSTKSETASRIRGRIESILDWATARGHRTGDNPARWRGLLDKLLPRRAKVKKVEHHPALPYTEMGAFMVALRKEDGLGAQALELLILTAARTGEIIAAEWPEFDLKGKLWVIPPGRIKAGKEHRVPLTDRAVVLLTGLLQARQIKDGVPCRWVFPGVRGKHLSNGAILALLKRMKRSDITAHGFRSTFRDWAAEQTSFPREVAEMALAHAIGNKVEAAYRRGDLFEKRKRLMDAWAKYVNTPPVKGAKVVPFQAAQG